MTSREQFLERVRNSVSAGNRAGGAPPLEARGSVGYQGAGSDPAARFCTEWTAAGGQVHNVSDSETAAARVVELVQAKTAQRVLLGGSLVASLGLVERLQGLG